ncbi:MAG TPA: glycosyltransferase family 39 protein [Anaerolineae bacterium]|nr:glycosyltransferase family 39 protein [Anaerolineae bacterium]HQH37229.1 glycosyltransferase family 39 protein [Anaerolineae bacterium]
MIAGQGQQVNARWRCGAVFMLWLLFALLISGARQISMTADEPAHIIVGYSLLAEGTKAFWLFPQHGHPPLLNVLEAALLRWAKPDIPLTQLDGWARQSMTDYFHSFVSYLTPIEQIEMTARLPIILCTILLGALIFRWGCEWWHPRAGLLSLCGLVFDPLMLAHGRLATTDVGSVMFGTATLYLVWRWQRRPSWKLALWAGLVLGLTLLAKGSGIIWAASIAMIILLTIIWRRRENCPTTLVLHGLLIGGLGLLILWAGYGFTWGKVNVDLPLSLPAPAHWNGLINQAQSVVGRWVFAFGERTHGGWWWYFPAAFLIKNPLPLLFGLGLGSIVLLCRRFDPRRLLTFSIFPLLYTILALTGGLNIGYRHLLPLHPFFYLIIGSGFWRWMQGPSWRRWVIWGLGVWYGVGTLRLFPYEIAFFNELVGGPQNGHHYLIDSNIDWGQGYKALRSYLAEHPGPTPQIAYHYAFIPPSLYGIEAVTLPPQSQSPPKAPFHPPAGRYVLSVTTLQAGWTASPDMYAWFREITPTANLGYAFFLYDIDPSPLQWFSQCTTPALPLTEEEIAAGVGNAPVRRVDFDCMTSWLYPGGGATPGIYAVHRYLVPEKAHALPTLLPAPPRAEDVFLARRLGEQRLSFDMRRFTAEFPAFSLYEPQQAPVPPQNDVVYLMGDAGLPTDTSTVLASPIPLQGPLTFVGATSYADGGGLTVETWWRVTAEPTARPFSLMAHLLDAQGTPLGVADGLGIASQALMPGDLLVQRHQFTVTSATPLWLRTGVYWADDLTRWSTIADPTADMLLIRLAP